MKDYLERLITEKGRHLDSVIKLEGHFGLTYAVLIDFIVELPEYHDEIRATLVQIDYLDGDVFHYLDHLAKGMAEAVLAT